MKLVFQAVSVIKTKETLNGIFFLGAEQVGSIEAGVDMEFQYLYRSVMDPGTCKSYSVQLGRPWN